jgi:hypothetical protein
MISIHTPSPTDILCGKDKTYELHFGNQLYRDMINSYALQYAMTNVKQDKMNMTAEIVSKLTESGSRFLRPMDGRWEMINTSAARDKTSHALRFCANQMQSIIGISHQSLINETMDHLRVSSSKKGKRGLKRKVSFDETKKSKLISPDAAESKRCHGIGLYGKANSSINTMIASTNLLIPELMSSSLSAIHDISSGDDRIINPLPLDFEQEFDMLPDYALQYFDDSI